MKLKYSLLSVAAAAALLCAPVVHAKPFKWASQGEIATWDIHSQNNALQNGIHANVYESLVYYNSKTFEVEPVLATAWKEVSPTQVRFTLRQGVKFHDGSTLTTDDAVYSIQRAMAKTSNFTPYVQGISKVVKVSRLTADVDLDFFNLFNTSTILGRQFDLNATNGDQPLEIMNPRVVRLGLRVRF